MNLKVKKLAGHATLPTKAHAGDLGYDLYALDQVIIWPGQTRLVSTGIAIQFPAGWGGFVKDRSSVATKLYLETVAGVIDNGYIGEIKVAMYNTDISSGSCRIIQAGEKIAQLVLIPTVDFPVEEVDEVIAADQRGTGGFGSTGS